MNRLNSPNRIPIRVSDKAVFLIATSPTIPVPSASNEQYGGIKSGRTKGPQSTYFFEFSTKDIVRFVIKEFIPAREIKEERWFRGESLWLGGEREGGGLH